MNRNRFETYRGWGACALVLITALAFAPTRGEADMLADKGRDRAASKEGETPSFETFASEASASPLRLADVLSAVETTHPKIEAALRKQQSAEGKRLSAAGNWDPTVVLEAKDTSGFYETTDLNAEVRQSTPLWGLDLYAGWRRGIGNYADYAGEPETLTAGELRAGAELPLWKGGPIDPERAAIEQTRARLATARCGRKTARLAVRRGAAEAYWEWVLAGLSVGIQEELLQTAKARDVAIRGRVALGSTAEIAVVDNNRLVLDRQAKLVAAERKFESAAIKLSLYYRDARLTPMVVPRGRVPTSVEEVTRMPTANVRAAIENALKQRPELCELFGEREAAEVAVRLARNQRAPEVNAMAEVSRDFGNGSSTLEPTTVKLGLKLKLPLLLREARGKLRAAEADLATIEAALRGLRDRVGAEIEQARVALDAAHRQVGFARAQLDAARTLADAERDKLREGASDLVVVNLRELAAAEAARLLAQTLVDLQISRVRYLTALGQGV